jgi:hypothetical protein
MKEGKAFYTPEYVNEGLKIKRFKGTKVRKLRSRGAKKPF